MKDSWVMKAFLITGPRQSVVEDLPDPTPQPHEAVVLIERVGICGTDIEFFNGEMAYLHSGEATYPLSIGHEWCGRVIEVGSKEFEPWLGKQVTGDTMLGCGDCSLCRKELQYLCKSRFEIGIRKGQPGALAEKLVVPIEALHELPESMDATTGALVEPGGNAWRAVHSSELKPGERLLIFGTGSIGILAGQIAKSQGLDVYLVGNANADNEFAKSLGFENVYEIAKLPEIEFAAAIDATFSADIPAVALDLVQPGGKIIYIGLSSSPSLIDTRKLVLKNITAIGILSASPGLKPIIEIFASGKVDPTSIVGATVALSEVNNFLSGIRPANFSGGPKIHVDPRM